MHMLIHLFIKQKIWEKIVFVRGDIIIHHIIEETPNLPFVDNQIPRLVYIAKVGDDSGITERAIP